MELSIIRLIIWCVLGITSTTAIKFQGKFEWDTEEHVTLKISDEGRYKRSRGGVMSFPDVMGINFDTANTSVSLSLRRNYGLDENLSVYVIKENSLVLQTLPLVTDTVFYQDVKHGAAFTVKFDEKTSKVLNLFGTLRLNNDAYFMERSGDFESGDDSHFRLRKYKVRAEKFVDIVQRKVGHGSDSKSDTSDFDKTRNRGKTGTGSRLDDSIYPIPSSRVKRAAVEQTVELMFTTDYSIYRYWYNDSNATSTAQKDLDAKTSIRQFYAHAINEIDAMYASVDSSSISINVVFACLVISESVATSEWTETRVSGGKVDASDVINNYTAWEQQLAISPCGYDHAMLFSKYDFTSTKNGEVSSAVAGVAWLSGACDSLKQSISGDSFNYNMNVIAAHELGHNLGADHDESGNSCPENNKNIMSPSIGPGPSSARDNPWKFSSCSVTYFETYITQLNTDMNNCLLTLSSDHDPTALTLYDRDIPGQVITADEQCVRLDGAGSHLCREFYTSDYSSMCYSMKCRISGSTSCHIYTAATGTTCGNQKWCFQSSCIANSSAPVVSDTCPYGDNPGIVYTSSSAVTYTCATLFQAFNKGTNCPIFLSRCCATCEAAYTSIPGCEYGDKATWCQVGGCSSSSYYRDTCCETCYVAPSTTLAPTTTTPVTTTTTPVTTTTTPVTTTTTPVTATAPPVTTTTTPVTKTTTPVTTTTTPVTTSTTPVTTTPTPVTTSTTPVTTTTTPVTTTNTPVTTSTTKITTTTTPVTTTTTPVTTTTTPITTSTTQVTTTTTPVTTTTTPDATTTTPVTTTATPATTTTTPVTTTTTPVTTTTNPVTTTASPVTTTTTPVTTTATPVTTTTTPVTTTTAPVTTTTTPVTTTTTPVTTTATPVTTTATSVTKTTTPVTTTTTPVTTTTTPVTTTTTLVAKTTTPVTTTTTPVTTTTTPVTTTTTPVTTSATQVTTTTTPVTTSTTQVTTSTTPVTTTTTPVATTITPVTTTTTPVTTSTTQIATTTTPEATTTTPEPTITTPDVTTTTQVTTTNTPEATTSKQETTTTAPETTKTIPVTTTTIPEATNTTLVVTTSTRDATTTTQVTTTNTPEATIFTPEATSTTPEATTITPKVTTTTREATTTTHVATTTTRVATSTTAEATTTTLVLTTTTIDATTTPPVATTSTPIATTTTPVLTTTTPDTTATTPVETTTTLITTTTTPVETTTTTTPTTTTTAPNTIHRACTIRIEVTIPVAIDLTNTSSPGYQATKQTARAALFIVYRGVNGFIDFFIILLRRGSLVVEHTIVMSNTAEANMGITNALVGLASGNTLTYNNQSAQTSAITLENNGGTQVPITVNSNPCDVFASTSTTGCGDGKTCEVVGGSATCLKIQQPSDDFAVLVGLGVGVTAVLLLVIIVLIWMCTRSRSRRHQTTKNTLRPGTPTFMPTRFHANVPSWSHQPAFCDNNGLDLSDSRKFMPASIENLPYYRNDYHETPRRKRGRAHDED